MLCPHSSILIHPFSLSPLFLRQVLVGMIIIPLPIAIIPLLTYYLLLERSLVHCLMDSLFCDCPRDVWSIVSLTYASLPSSPVALSVKFDQEGAHFKELHEMEMPFLPTYPLDDAGGPDADAGSRCVCAPSLSCYPSTYFAFLRLIFGSWLQ